MNREPTPPNEPAPPAPGARPVTMQDVAELAGVHISTASRGLDPLQRRRLSDATVARVQAAADQLGYTPDLIAAGLKRGRTKTVGIVVSDLVNPFTGPLTRGFAGVVEEHGFLPLIAETAENSERLEPIFRHFISRRVEAIVTTAVHTTDASLVRSVTTSGVPIVLALRGISTESFPSVLHDDVTGGFLAASHLVELGHRVVARLPGPADIDTFERRQQGFLSRLSNANVRDVTLDEIPVATTLEEGRRLMHLLLSTSDPLPTGIFAANDVMAIGAIDALAERGLSCPEDVSVVGYDDMPLVGRITPSLTTISLPAEELGRTAARMAMRMIEQPDSKPETVRLPATLIVRGSTAAPSRDGRHILTTRR